MRRVVAAFAVGAVAGFAAARIVSPDGASAPEDASDVSRADPEDREETRRRAGRGGAPRRGEPSAGADAGPQDPSSAPSPPVAAPAPRPGSAAEILARIEGESVAHSPPRDGIVAFSLAGQFVASTERPLPPVGLDLIRRLFAGPGHAGQAARVLLGFVSPEAAATEVRRWLAGNAAPWKGSSDGEVMRALLRLAGPGITDEEALACFRTARGDTRGVALEQVIARRALAGPELLRIARSDEVVMVRVRAMEALVGGKVPGTEAGDVEREVLRLSRSPDDPLFTTGIHLLCEIGPSGAERAAELLADGGIDPACIDSVAAALLRAGKFDVLSKAALTGPALARLYRALAGQIGGADATAPRDAVAGLVRGLPLPDERELATLHFEVAIASGAPDIAVSAATRRDLAAWIRVVATGTLTDMETSEAARPAAVVAAARSILENDPVDAARRREFVDDDGVEVAEASAEGRALIARIAEHDPDPWVRRAAREALAAAQAE